VYTAAWSEQTKIKTQEEKQEQEFAGSDKICFLT